MLFRKQKPKVSNAVLNSNDKKHEKDKEKSISKKEATFDFINASKEFEKSRIGDIEASKNLAWRVAIGACVLAICAVVSIIFLMPLKEVKPYVIRVDNNTFLSCLYGSEP